jgi:hypothetical protein
MLSVVIVTETQPQLENTEDLYIMLLLFILMVFYQKSSEISDIAAVGLRGKVFETWNYDLSNTYGKTHLVST